MGCAFVDRSCGSGAVYDEAGSDWVGEGVAGCEDDRDDGQPAKVYGFGADEDGDHRTTPSANGACCESLLFYLA